ncbi:MAG: glycosyltransferase family 9 protein [Bacteroidota bacterium]|nr:glycosyltransferase family 9 protein [Bacteroidota bacterium]
MQNTKAVRKILIIRLQATGDVVIMLPYIQSLRSQLPSDVTIDLLVREECKEIPQQLSIFDRVYVLKGGRNTKLQLVHFLGLLPKLRLQGYDVLLDLQNHRLSKVMRKLLGIKTFSVFDRTSSNYAGDRYKNTINVVGLPPVSFQKLKSFKTGDEERLLKKFGLKKDASYVVINPGGAFKNRNWELKNYVEFCKLWLKEPDPQTKFLVLGISKIRKQTDYFKSELGESIIDLVGKTSQAEAILLLKQAKLVISEDSGLLHMSYVTGTPTIGLLGSTRNDWTNPNLPHTYFFNSSNLPCGNCMLETCIHNEILCMTSIKPKDVIDSAIKLLN